MKLMLPLVLAAMAGLASPVVAGDKDVTVWKSPTCGCCTGWAEYLQHNGYSVRQIDVDDLDAVKKAHGVPAAMESCHTARIGGYVVEGHVPVEAIDKLLKERPKVRGIASPGMPMGSPGMSGPKEENVIHTFGADGTRVYGRY
ncbi:DUF411 domain-containing protein [Magnetospirillum sp. SS-4]|uniref:DUF411 domain-containing protein n=1 Tax=Magnetospirillum sp. SS-4 TaxID=2681465 RepID=UPI0020C5246F|nr:DUF411 domain-containing protein [Magnetospirillum sp. SS-4]